MGFFDKLFNYRDAGEKPSAKNLENFGEPVRCLHRLPLGSRPPVRG